MTDPESGNEDEYEEKEEEEEDDEGETTKHGVPQNSDIMADDNEAIEERSLSVVNEEDNENEAEGDDNESATQRDNHSAEEGSADEHSDYNEENDDEDQTSEGRAEDSLEADEEEENDQDELADEVNIDDGEDEELNKVFTDAAERDELPLYKEDDSNDEKKFNESEGEDDLEEKKEEEEEEEGEEEEAEEEEEEEGEGEKEEEEEGEIFVEETGPEGTEDHDDNPEDPVNEIAVHEDAENEKLNQNGDDDASENEELKEVENEEDEQDSADGSEDQQIESNSDHLKTEDTTRKTSFSSEHERARSAKSETIKSIVDLLSTPSRVTSSRRVRFRDDSDATTDVGMAQEDNKNRNEKTDETFDHSILADSSRSTFISLDEENSNKQQSENDDDDEENDEKSSDEAYSTEEAEGLSNASSRSTSALRSWRLRSALSLVSLNSNKRRMVSPTPSGEGRLWKRRNKLHSAKAATTPTSLYVDVDGRTQTYLEEVRSRMQSAVDMIKNKQQLSNDNEDVKDGLLKAIQDDLENSLTVVKVTAQTATGFRSTLRELYKTLEDVSSSVWQPLQQPEIETTSKLTTVHNVKIMLYLTVM